MKLFWDKVDKRGDNECWPWKDACDPMGYPRYSNGPYVGLDIMAHRSAWILVNGPIPEGYRFKHSCGVRNCCNPAHLVSWRVKRG